MGNKIIPLNKKEIMSSQRKNAITRIEKNNEEINSKIIRKKERKKERNYEIAMFEIITHEKEIGRLLDIIG